MELVLDSFLDMLLDTVKALPFLFIAYLLIELIEHRAGDKTLDLIHRSGKWGPLWGGALGIIPQCGFSAATANLYTGGVVSRGTLIAVFLSTSDEMLPILISKNAPFALIMKILAAKLICAVIVGFIVDLVLKPKHEKHIHDMCENHDCGCEKNIFRSALVHTGKIAVFIAAVTFILNIFVGLMGEDRLASFILNKPIVGEMLAGIVGLIPNCAASVVITELYLGGGMSVGAMLSGLLVGSGIGMLVLFRMNRDVKDNLITLGITYISGVVCGFLLGLLPIF